MSAWACSHCGRGRFPKVEGDLTGRESPDPCIGILPLVSEACCGHGKPQEAYLMIEDVQLSKIKGIDVFGLPQGSTGKLVYRVTRDGDPFSPQRGRPYTGYLWNGVGVALFEEATALPCTLELWVSEQAYKKVVLGLFTGEIPDRVALQDVALCYLDLGEAPTLVKVPMGIT